MWMKKPQIVQLAFVISERDYLEDTSDEKKDDRTTYVRDNGIVTDANNGIRS